MDVRPLATPWTVRGRMQSRSERRGAAIRWFGEGPLREVLWPQSPVLAWLFRYQGCAVERLHTFARRFDRTAPSPAEGARALRTADAPFLRVAEWSLHDCRRC